MIRRGIVFEAREAVAIVHEVCRQMGTFPSGVIGDPDALWVDANGSLSVAESGTASTKDAASGIAILLDKLLPVNRPEYAMTPSLRTLPARLRASAEAVRMTNASDLLVILRWHLNEDPGRVLEHLFMRVRALEPTREQALTGPETIRAVSAMASGRATPVHSSDEGFGAFAAESENQGLHEELAQYRDPDVFRVEAFGPVLNEQAGRPTRTVARILAAMAVVMASGYVGYRLGSVPATYMAQTATGTAQPQRETANGPEQTRRERTLVPPPAAVAGADQAPSAPTDSSNPERGRVAAAPHPLMMAVGEAFSPSFAPGGGKLLFHSGRTGTGRLFEADLDQRGQPSRIIPIIATSVAGTATKDYHARLSPDARLIAFDSDRDGKRGVYIANPDGSQATRLSGDGFAAVPSWSPDMKWLSFLRAEPDHPRVWNLWLRDLASGTLSRQTSFKVGQVWGASWFPDSRRLCYSHEDQLIITNIASGESESFRTPRSRHLVRTPAVAPDGKRIVFQVFRDGVWLLELPTRSMRRILNDVTAEEFAWDPEGRRFAYHSRRDGTWRIWIATVSEPQ
jgi:Tol biopolymer transport system component